MKITETALEKKERLNKGSRERNSRYWKTFNGKLMLTYNNMTRRVDGLSKPHLYRGLDICPRDVFYAWSKGNLSFNSLYRKWVESGYERKLSPSIDRINPKEGYTFENIRWITHSENSRIGSASRWNNNKIIV